jgi:hypothetical protein
VQLRRILTLAVLATLAACGGRTPPPATGPGGPAPSAAVERFLRLVESKNYREMGNVFGTESGTIIQRDPLSEVEQRMYAIASVLEHDRFVIRNESPVPGRIGSAVRLMVEITQRNRTRQVPFVAVRSGTTWLVEQVDLERVTRDPS